MKQFPSYSDLSDEQLIIYGFSHETPLLIKGGPGSGKTVMALWRSASAKEKGKKVRVCMYNNTLLNYTTPYLETVHEGVQAEEISEISTVIR